MGEWRWYSLMVGGFCGQNDTHVEMGMTYASRSTADYGVEAGHESNFASEQSLTRDSHTHGRTPFVFPSDTLPSTLTRGLVARSDGRF